MAGEIYVARDSGVVEVDGVPYPIQKGQTRVRAEHPIYLQAPGLFEPIEDHVTYDIERATAAPGEKRGTKPASKAAPKEAGE